MHINELPDIVLARVFYWACNDSIYPPYVDSYINIWRPKLALLAVCRTWRELTLTSAHRVSFIQCNTIRPKNRGNGAVHNFYDSESSDTQRNSGALDELGDKMCVVKSNLDIIGNTGKKYCPRTIHIFVKSSNDPIYSLQHMIEKLRSHTTLLTKVVRMEFEYEELRYLRTDEITTNATGVSSIGEEFSRLMPHVQHIRYAEYIDSNILVDFAQYLVKGYAHQLTGFKGPQFALGKVQNFSDKLKHAHIYEHFECIDSVPKIYAENLTHLTLYRVKNNFAWSTFESNGRLGSLHFANLKWLKLGVALEHDHTNFLSGEIRGFSREFNYKVIAPRLEAVVLQLFPFTLSFLASIYGLTTIPNVELELDWPKACFTDFDLDIARDKFASYAKNSHDDFETIDSYAYLNDMFNIYGLAKSSKSVVGSEDPLDFERIDWKYLSNIEIYSPFHVNELRTLVSKAPSLESVYVNEINIKENGELIPEIQNESATVELLSSSLKTISFEFLIDCTESEEDKFMVYLNKLTRKRLTPEVL